METKKKVLGAEHPDTLNSMGDLAHIYKSQGRHNEAVDLMENVVKLCIPKTGPTTLTLLNGSKLWTNGKIWSKSNFGS